MRLEFELLVAFMKFPLLFGLKVVLKSLTLIKEWDKSPETPPKVLLVTLVEFLLLTLADTLLMVSFVLRAGPKLDMSFKVVVRKLDYFLPATRVVTEHALL